MGEYISEDMTFCVADCKNKAKCERNPKRIKMPHFPHSYADFSNVCEDYENIHMDLERAIKVLKQKYEQAKDNPQINDPVAWSLYRTWRIADNERKKSLKK